MSELRIKVVVEKPAAEESTAVGFDQRFLAPALPAPVKGIDSVSSAKPNFAEILKASFTRLMILFQIILSTW